jgi:hypothetical protein
MCCAGTVVIGSTTPPKGNWQITYDGLTDNINWAAIAWTATVPQYTQLVMQMRVANNPGLLCGAFEIFNGSLCVSTASYTTLSNSRMISTRGEYMQVRASCMSLL